MRQLKLVAATDFFDAADAADLSEEGKTVRLLADLERGGTDRDLGVRAAKFIRELIQQKEQAAALMLESSALLNTALARLHALKALI